VAAETIAWGEPVLASAIATVSDGRLIYRGHDAATLAQSRTLEEIAALLWEADAAIFARLPPAKPVRADSAKEAAFLTMARRAARDEPAYGRSPGVLHIEAAGLVHALLGAFGGAGEATMPLHARLAAAWSAPAAADVVRRVLVLMADHELNASTFAARVTASTGASLAASVLAGLAALTGPLHGGTASRVQALAADAKRDGAERAVRAWLAQGRLIPGFGHQLYPEGDARALALIEAFAPPPLFARLRAAVGSVVGEEPNIDFALAALTSRFALPEDAPFILFTLARSVGWIAHAIEQVTTGGLIRPRARYSGPPPAADREGEETNAWQRHRTHASPRRRQIQAPARV
jgi:citrate synthase